MTIRIHTDNTITREGEAIPFARIDRDSFKLPSGKHRGTTTVRVYETGESFEMTAPLYAPKVEGSVSDWGINPEFVRELEERA